MSAATFIPGNRAGGQGPPRRGATATGSVHHSPHRLGNALRAVRAFTEAFFSVTVLGEYNEEAGVRRRH
ncbi:hypothetical protein ACFYY3_12670 [Streptomyces sp. NPDC001812]|uniref:Uncharacterized protein n=1 Tax=Streptomyces cathayae TaxID=3031124 RepID=A0ABY8K4E6_9ACTN|nr:hypothetical protein [Streptomyces sp. HUAS 5]WGD42254.1 hypothetical protein PYS65_20095 [Streptomyces sp. HUAS 5]